MRAYFDRTQSLFLAREASFDGVPIEAPEKMVIFLEELRKIDVRLKEKADFAGAPEDIGQGFIDELVDSVTDAIVGYMS